MTDEISLTIDGQTVSVPAGTTLLAAARGLGIDVPTICQHDACTANAVCRMCVVEVEGARTLPASCAAPVAAGMQVRTDSDRVRLARRTILEMLASSVDLSDAPEIAARMVEYEADAGRFPEAAGREQPVIDDNPMFVRDYEKCVLCWRCVQVCAEDAQYTFAINFSGRGYETSIATWFDKPLPETTCVFCGQCVGVCPTGALKPKRQWLLEQGKSPAEVLAVTGSGRRRKRI
jgi:NADH dehydrogenase/NADH:ubiquinone oxidoreductase subunit G